MDHRAQAAYQLRMAIEQGQPEPGIGELTASLVREMGGQADIRQMTTGAASIYLLSLLLSQP